MNYPTILTPQILKKKGSWTAQFLRQDEAENRIFYSVLLVSEQGESKNITIEFPGYMMPWPEMFVPYVYSHLSIRGLAAYLLYFFHNLRGPHRLADSVGWQVDTRTVAELGGQEIDEVTAELPVVNVILRFGMPHKKSADANAEEDLLKRFATLERNLALQIKFIRSLSIFEISGGQVDSSWSARLLEYDLRFLQITFALTINLKAGSRTWKVRVKTPQSDGPVEARSGIYDGLSWWENFYRSRFALCHFPEPFSLLEGASWTAELAERTKNRLAIDLCLHLACGTKIVSRETVDDLTTDSWEGERTRVGEALETCAQNRLKQHLETHTSIAEVSSLPIPKILPHGGQWSSKFIANGLTYVFMTQQELPDGSRMTLSFPPVENLGAGDFEYLVELIGPDQGKIELEVWLSYSSQELSNLGTTVTSEARVLPLLQRAVDKHLPATTCLEFSETNGLPGGFGWIAKLSRIREFRDLYQYDFDYKIVTQQGGVVIHENKIYIDEPLLAEVTLLRERLRLMITFKLAQKMNELQWIENLDRPKQLEEGSFWSAKLVSYFNLTEPQYEFEIVVNALEDRKVLGKTYVSAKSPFKLNRGTEIEQELTAWVRLQIQGQTVVSFPDPMPLPAKASWTARFVKTESRLLSGFAWESGADYVMKMYPFLYYEVTIKARDGAIIVYEIAIPEPDADEMLKSEKIISERCITIPAAHYPVQNEKFRNSIYQKLYDLVYRHWRWTRVFDFSKPMTLDGQTTWSARHIPSYTDESAHVRYVITVHYPDGKAIELIHCLARPSNEVAHDRPLTPEKTREEVERILAAGGRVTVLRTRWRTEKKGVVTKLSKWIRKQMQKSQAAKP